MNVFVDDRGVSEVLGGILVFGLLIALIALLQINAVPAANKQVEAQHADKVDEDFVRTYGGLMNAADEHGNYTAALDLGVDYPPRFMFLNPPASQGTLSSSEIGELNGNIPGVSGSDNALTDLCGIDPDEEINAFRYEPNYNHLGGVGTHGYETSIMYQRVDDNLAGYEQGLVAGNTIRLRPLVGDTFTRASSGTQAVQIFAGTTGHTSGVTLDSDDTLTIPTTLNQSHWNKIAADTDKISDVDVDEAADTATITFTSGTYTIECTPLGVGESPGNSPHSDFQSPNDDTDTPPGEDDIINPVHQGALVLKGVSKVSGGANMTFDNTGPENLEIVGVRTFFTSAPGNQKSEINSFNITYQGEPEDKAAFVETGGYEYTDVTWTLPPNSNYIEMVATGQGKNWDPNSQTVALSIEFKDDDGNLYHRLYFIHGAS